MNINKHNVAMRWITRRRTNEVAGLYESFPGTFSAYQEALSSGFQGTMEEFMQIQSIPQGDRPFTGKVGGLVEPGVTHYATKVKAKHLGSGLFETTYPGGSKSYYGSIVRKGKKLKFNSKDKNEVLEWLEKKKKLKTAPTIVEQQTAKGLLLDKPKYTKALEKALDEVFAMQEKGYGGVRELTQKYKDMFSKKGTIQYGRKLTTDITTEGTALVNAIRSQVKKFGIEDVNTKKMEKALDFYRNKKIINQGDIAKIAKKFDVNYNTLSGTLFKKDYRKLIPLQEGTAAEKKKAIAKAYNDAKKIYSSPTYENLIKGTPETQLGHATDLYSQYVTPEDLVYTPAKINQEALKDIDAAQKSIYEKRAKLFKNKPLGWQKEVERLNAKGMFLADKSQGYKNFNVMRADGSTYKYGVVASKTIDPTGVATGKKLKDLTKEEKALIELNRKNVLKSQSKLGKKEINKTAANILSKVFRCGQADGISCDNPKAYIKSINEQKALALAGDAKAAAKFNKVSTAVKAARGISKFTLWGILGEVAFAPLFALPMLAKGESWSRIMNDISWGLYGESEQEELKRVSGTEGTQSLEALEAGEKLTKLESLPLSKEVAPLDSFMGDLRRKEQLQARSAAVIAARKKELEESGKTFIEKIQPYMVNGSFDVEAFEKAGGDVEAARAQIAEEKLARKESSIFFQDKLDPTEAMVGFDAGGRVGFKLGGIDKGRRAFMKWLAGITGAGIAAGTGLLKFGKFSGKGKTVIKAGDHIIQGTPGMPDWFIPLINRIVKEGDDVTKKLGTVEREIVHTKKIAPGEEVTVYNNLDTGNVRVEYNSPNIMGEGSVGPVQLEYRAGEVITEGKHAGKKTKSEFEAMESEPVGHTHGPDDYSIEWDGTNVVGKVEDLTSDTSKLKEFGTKRNLTHKDKVIAKKKQKEVQKVHENESDYIVSRQGEGEWDDYLPDIDDLD